MKEGLAMKKFLVTLIHEETLEVKKITVEANNEIEADEIAGYHLPFSNEFFINDITEIVEK